jgi:hypothetical protein
MRHYHVIENAVGEPHGYRDDVFRNRRRALIAAKERAEWLAAVAGLRVESLVGTGRYFITTGRPSDAGPSDCGGGLRRGRLPRGRFRLDAGRLTWSLANARAHWIETVHSAGYFQMV